MFIAVCYRNKMATTYNTTKWLIVEV